MKEKDSLQDLFPKQTKVKFESEKLSGREFTVNKISLADDAWMLNEFNGKAGLIDVFAKSDYRAMARIFYRLLADDDKDFLTDCVQLTLRGEEGGKTEVKSNVDKILYMLDIRDLEKMAESLMNARGVSLPKVADAPGSKEDIEGNGASL